MGKEILENRLDDELVEYFYWLLNYIDCDAYPACDYDRVLWKLMTTRFIVSIDNDQNRVDDALDFRTRFVPWWMDIPVSILEIMVSMAVRIEDTIMKNTSENNRTAEWFWDMMQNLGLRQQSNDIYDGDEYVDKILHDFNNRKYEKNGLGSLFITRDRSKDMRKMELWFQMHAEFNDILQDEGLLNRQ